jgi:hypothetical protein
VQTLINLLPVNAHVCLRLFAEEEWGADGKGRGPPGADQSGEFNNLLVLPSNLMFRVLMSVAGFVSVVWG